MEANNRRTGQTDLCEERAAGWQLLDRHEGSKLASSFSIIDGAGQDCMRQLQMRSQHLCKVHVQLPRLAQLVMQRHLCTHSRLTVQSLNPRQPAGQF